MAMIDTLKNSELFEGFETEHLQRLSALCRGDSFREGTTIFKEGNEATEL